MTVAAASFMLVLAGTVTHELQGVARPYAYQEQGWRVSCRPGEDGFAVNCTAENSAGEHVFRLSAADSQMFVIIEHPECQVEYRNFFREDLFSLTAEERRELIIAAFRQIAANMATECPWLAPVEADFSYLPDIAMAPVDRTR